MPTDYSNFTIPDNTIDPHPNSTGAPPQDDAYWDPIQKRWLGKNSGDGRSMPSVMGTRPPGTTWDMNSKQWVPANTGRSDGSTDITGQFPGGNATTEGRVEADDTSNGANVGGSYGGYTGTMVMGPDGKLVLDSSMSGRAEDVDRFRGLGAAAAGREAYKNDYTQANEDAARAGEIRTRQDEASGMARDVAMNGDAQSQMLGRNMLAAGANAQKAVAVSARGGSLAQAAALRTQQNGQGAFMQQGNNALAAQKADDMAAGRDQYMKNTTATRAGDATAANLHTSQATEQMKNELFQRGLNQSGQMGYEEMGFNVNKADQDAALKRKEIQAGIDAAAALRAQKLADKDLANAAAGASALGSGLSTIAGAMPGEEPEKKKPDPFANDVANSDYRTKMGVRSLAAIAATRGGR